MARLRDLQTGSVVNVPDEKVAQVSAVGYYEVLEEPKATKAASKKTSPSKSK